MFLRSFVFAFILCLYPNIINKSCVEAGTLALVIDNSRSMWNELDQMKSAIRSIGLLQLKRLRDPDVSKNYVLVTFDDAGAVLRLRTTLIMSLHVSINNIPLHNHENPDCTEMSLTGLETALLTSGPGSIIYVFTDASAKDYEKVYRIKTLCQQNKSQVTFMLTGDCGSPSDIKYTVYQEIAAACSGQTFHHKKNLINMVVQMALTPEVTNSTSSETPEYADA